jgi:hypothetical protein
VTIKPTQRRGALIALAVGLGAVAIFDGEEASRSTVSAAPASRAPAPSGMGARAPLPDIALDKLDEKIPRDPVGDAFEVRSWEPPAPPRKEPPPHPPPPQAPPLPYTYVGKIMDGGQVIVFLAKQDRNYMVKEGETLDGIYRIDDINAGTMLFTYLPLNQQQILAIGAAN